MWTSGTLAFFCTRWESSAGLLDYHNSTKQIDGSSNDENQNGFLLGLITAKMNGRALSLL